MRKRTIFAQVTVLLLACAMVLLVASPTFAQKPFLARLKTMYNLSPEFGTCKICHTVPPGQKPKKENLNAYGKDIQADPAFAPVKGKNPGKNGYSEQDLKAVEAAIKNVANKDSDGDGATNEEELTLGTYPGDAKSTPPADILKNYRAQKAAGKFGAAK